MANDNVSGWLNCTDGTLIPLDSELAEGTEADLYLNEDFSVSSSVNVGDYAPGKTVTHATIQGADNISYCYILRQGLIATILPVSIKGASGPSALPLCAPFTLQPGDIVRCLCLAASGRVGAICVYTNRGVYRIFDGTSAGGNVEFVDLQTNNSVGDTLQGQVIVRAFFCAGTVSNCELIDGGGALMLNEKGMPVGGVPANSPINAPVTWSVCSIPVALNYKWNVNSSA